MQGKPRPEQGDEEYDGDEDSSEPIELLAPDMQWQGCVSFEGLGRDVVGLIARQLNAADCLSLALTSKKQYERIRAKKLLRCSKTRFMSRYPKSKISGLNVRPLVGEMLTIPMPPFPQVVPTGRKCFLVYTTERTTGFVDDSVFMLKRVFEKRGFVVELCEFTVHASFILTARRLNPNAYRDTDSKVAARLRQIDRFAKSDTIRVGGGVVVNGDLAELMAFHYDFVCNLKAAPADLIVDMCFRLPTVRLLRRLLESDACSLPEYMHCYTDGRRPILNVEKPVCPRLNDAPTAAETRAELAALGDRQLHGLLRCADFRRQMVVLQGLIVSKNGMRLVRAVQETCNRLNADTAFVTAQAYACRIAIVDILKILTWFSFMWPNEGEEKQFRAM